MTNYRLDALIMTLTVGELIDLIRELIHQQEPAPATTGRLVYGLHGIETLFGVSHKTAQMYKDTFLAPAVKQNGRKIVVDADLAMELFNERKAK